MVDASPNPLSADQAEQAVRMAVKFTEEIPLFVHKKITHSSTNESSPLARFIMLPMALMKLACVKKAKIRLLAIRSNTCFELELTKRIKSL